MTFDERFFQVHKRVEKKIISFYFFYLEENSFSGHCVSESHTTDGFCSFLSYDIHVEGQYFTPFTINTIKFFFLDGHVNEKLN